MFSIDERTGFTFALRCGDNLQRQGGFTGGFRTVNLDDTAHWQTAGAQRDIQRKRAGGDGFHIHGAVFTGRMMEPLPNCFSIWPSAAANAFCLFSSIAIVTPNHAG